ncbi:plasmid pRiA4b ORF-3 family protein [Oceanobacillus timonensis]|uniref:plasmid pRiA4b ORF-3 family protein n=1 Tax=Oceanobacillus timonensis TaxID=1926285 RepID=UPI001C4E1F53|nr:plasmid pRiA4b ORF-3 family protein [Oceanobacillus timonensis]
MKNNRNMTNEEIAPVRLHLELTDDYLSDFEKRMLKRYGESLDGKSISRDILIPSDMPLHNLHYAIQKLFGWKNSHLRKFQLPKSVYQNLTGNTVKGWSDLVGDLFQPPSEAERDIFWDEDYRSGSINTWLKKKYTGPYVYGGNLEHPEAAKQDIQQMLDHFSMIEVQESVRDYLDRMKENPDAERKTLRKAPLIDLTLDEMNATLTMEGGKDSLLERLEADKLLAAQNESMNDEALFPVTRELFYQYDFGDNWTVTITKHADYADLLQQNLIGEEELTIAEAEVLDKHKPICIHKQGINVYDDVGGLSGFAEFLGAIYEGDKSEASEARAWAKSLGWNVQKISNKKML